MYRPGPQLQTTLVLPQGSYAGDWGQAHFLLSSLTPPHSGLGLPAWQ